MGFDEKWANTMANKYNVVVNNSEILEDLNMTKGKCPCVPSYAQTRDTLCPCKKTREEQECICGLFKKK